MKQKITWLDEPEDHDYPAAESFLTLLASPEDAAHVVRLLRAADVVNFKVKDILRASGLPALGIENKHVHKDSAKIASGEKLSPILLVRSNGKVVIADGYHRTCAVYLHDEDAEISCKLV